MGRAVILIVLGSCVIALMTGSNMGIVTTEGTKNVAESYKNYTARSIAKDGVDLCIMQLAGDRHWRAGYAGYSLSGGTLAATLSTVDAEHVQIQSTGLYMDRTKTITAVVHLPPGDMPVAFNYALASDGPLTLNGTVDVLVNDPTQNVNATIASNDRIVTGTQVRVEGFGYSTGSITCNPLDKLPTVFVPHYNPEGLPKYVPNAPRVDIPDFNPDSYKATADEVYEGDLALSGNQTYGNFSKPKIVWVGGTLKLSGGVDFNGAYIFIVKGDILITGNVTSTGAGSLSTCGLYSSGSVKISGTPTVEGQIYATRDLTVNGNATIIGSAVVHSNEITVTTLTGSAQVRYRGANPILTTPVWSTNPRPEMDSWWE